MGERKHFLIRRDVKAGDVESESFVDEFREAIVDNLPLGIGVVFAVAAPAQLDDAVTVKVRHVNDDKLKDMLRGMTRAALGGGAITSDEHERIMAILGGRR